MVAQPPVSSGLFAVQAVYSVGLFAFVAWYSFVLFDGRKDLSATRVLAGRYRGVISLVLLCSLTIIFVGDVCVLVVSSREGWLDTCKSNCSVPPSAGAQYECRYLPDAQCPLGIVKRPVSAFVVSGDYSLLIAGELLIAIGGMMRSLATFLVLAGLNVSVKALFPRPLLLGAEVTLCFVVVLLSLPVVCMFYFLPEPPWDIYLTDAFLALHSLAKATLLLLARYRTTVVLRGVPRNYVQASRVEAALIYIRGMLATLAGMMTIEAVVFVGRITVAATSFPSLAITDLFFALMLVPFAAVPLLLVMTVFRHSGVNVSNQGADSSEPSDVVLSGTEVGVASPRSARAARQPRDDVSHESGGEAIAVGSEAEDVLSFRVQEVEREGNGEGEPSRARATPKAYAQPQPSPGAAGAMTHLLVHNDFVGNAAGGVYLIQAALVADANKAVPPVPNSPLSPNRPEFKPVSEILGPHCPVEAAARARPAALTAETAADYTAFQLREGDSEAVAKERKRERQDEYQAGQDAPATEGQERMSAALELASMGEHHANLTLPALSISLGVGEQEGQHELEDVEGSRECDARPPSPPLLRAPPPRRATRGKQLRFWEQSKYTCGECGPDGGAGGGMRRGWNFWSRAQPRREELGPLTPERRMELARLWLQDAVENRPPKLHRLSPMPLLCYRMQNSAPWKMALTLTVALQLIVLPFLEPVSTFWLTPARLALAPNYGVAIGLDLWFTAILLSDTLLHLYSYGWRELQFVFLTRRDVRKHRSGESIIFHARLLVCTVCIINIIVAAADPLAFRFDRWLRPLSVVFISRDVRNMLHDLVLTFQDFTGVLGTYAFVITIYGLIGATLFDPATYDANVVRFWGENSTQEVSWPG